MVHVMLGVDKLLIYLPPAGEIFIINLYLPFQFIGDSRRLMEDQRRILIHLIVDPRMGLRHFQTAKLRQIHSLLGIFPVHVLDQKLHPPLPIGLILRVIGVDMGYVCFQGLFQILILRQESDSLYTGIGSRRSV